MTKKITITLPEEYFEQAKQLAEEAGLPLSTWIAQTVEHETRIRVGLAAMREWEAEHGALTEESLRRHAPNWQLPTRPRGKLVVPPDEGSALAALRF